MNYHIIGIRGSSLSGIAQLLRAERNTVSGSDSATTGHGAHLIPDDTEVVLYSEAITPGSAGYPELVAARERGIKTLRRIEFIAERMNGKIGIAVAGAHGKSTTTAQIGWSLVAAGEDPTVFIGADLPAFGGSARSGTGRFVVSEACEWNRQFLFLKPTVLVVTMIDREHLDTYPGGIDEIIAAFRQAASQVDPAGFIVANADDEYSRRAFEGIDRRVIWFGSSEAADYQITVAESVKGMLGVGYLPPSMQSGYLVSPLVGVHHATNLMASVVTLEEQGVEHQAMLESITSFPGLKRRFERYRDDQVLTVVDDYAHHPAEVAATLKAVRQRYTGRRLIAVFQPHLSQRTTDLFNEFVDALTLADIVVLAETYEPGGRAVIAGAKTSSDLAQALRDRSIEVIESVGLDQTFETVKQVAQSGDVCLTLGATSIWRVAEKLAALTPNGESWIK